MNESNDGTREKHRARSTSALRRVLWIAASLSFPAGILIAALTVCQLREISGRLRKDIEHLEALRSMKRDVMVYEAAKSAFERSGAGQPPEIEAMVASRLSEYNPQVRRRENRELLPGWSLVQREVSLPRVPLGKTAQFIESVEREQPGWRLEKITAHALPQSPGSGRVVLLFKTIMRIE